MAESRLEEIEVIPQPRSTKLMSALTNENKVKAPVFLTLYKRTTISVVKTRFFRISEIGLSPPPASAINMVTTFTEAAKTPITTNSLQLKYLFFIIIW